MIKILREEVMRFIKEELPVRGVDLLIEGFRIARNFTDKAARLIADGTIPAPGFIVDFARDRVTLDDDYYYRVAEPEHGWDRSPGEVAWKEKEKEKEVEASSVVGVTDGKKEERGQKGSDTAKSRAVGKKKGGGKKSSLKKAKAGKGSSAGKKPARKQKKKAAPPQGQGE